MTWEAGNQVMSIHVVYAAGVSLMAKLSVRMLVRTVHYWHNMRCCGTMTYVLTVGSASSVNDQRCIH